MGEPSVPTRPTLSGSFGMVASTHWLASATAMGVLERGGNAYDAAVAGGFVLQVAEPHLNGPGGEVPVVAWSVADRSVSVVCGQGVAPATASIQAYTDLGLDIVPGTGLLAATVPGAFGGWLRLLERWGTWSLRDVLSPAIGYARHGVPSLPGVTRTIAAVEALFADHWPTSAARWLAGGGVPAVGTTLTNPVLADVYDRVVAEAEAATADRDGQLEAARRTWYSGFVTEAIEGFCAGEPWLDTSGERHRGLVTGADLAGWQASVEPAALADYHDVTVAKTQAWGQGPVFGQQLQLLAGLDLAGAGHLSADYLHLVTECSKLAFADREAWYGDSPPDPRLLDALLSPSYADARRRLVGEQASGELRAGSPLGLTPLLPPVVVAGGQAQATGLDPTAPAPSSRTDPSVSPEGRTRGDTVHIDVADRFGNLVSATPSGGWLQSSPTIPELGFCLGNRAQMFWLTPGLPSSLRPGARPRTTLSPGIALRDGEPWLAFGTPGGDQQDQWSLAFFLSLCHGGRDLQGAIDAPTFHHDHVPSSFWPRQASPLRLAVEDRVGADVLADLRRRGHEVVASPGWSLGRVCAVERRPDGTLRAAADARGAQAYAAGR